VGNASDLDSESVWPLGMEEVRRRLIPHHTDTADAVLDLRSHRALRAAGAGRGCLGKRYNHFHERGTGSVRLHERGSAARTEEYERIRNCKRKRIRRMLQRTSTK